MLMYIIPIFPFLSSSFARMEKFYILTFFAAKIGAKTKFVYVMPFIKKFLPVSLPIPTIHAIATYGCAVANERRLSFSRKYAIMKPTKEVFYEKYQRTNLFISDEMRTFSA